MVEVKNGLVYRNGKVVSVQDLYGVPKEEFKDPLLYSAVKRSEREKKPLVVADAGQRKGTKRFYVILNSTKDVIWSLKNSEIFMGSYGFSSMTHLYYVRFFSYLGADLREKFFKNHVVYETPVLKEYVKKLKRVVEVSESATITDKERENLISYVKNSGGEIISGLLPHQEKFLYLAIKRLNFLSSQNRKLGLFLADDMGLGKTLQTLALVKALNAYPLVVICPKSATDVWKAEVEEWLGVDAKVYSTKDTGFDGTYKVHIFPVSIFSLKSFQENLPKFYREKIGFVAVDESHTIKNYGAKRTRAVLRFVDALRRNNKGLIALAVSGTPQTVSPEDYLPQLHLIGFLDNEGINFKEFKNRYVLYTEKEVRTKDGKKKKINPAVGAKNPYELNLWLKASVMIKRKRSDALKNLPEKGVSVEKVALIHKKEYKKALKEFREDPHKYQFLRQWLSIEKVSYTLKLIREALEEGSKVVVLAHYKETQEILKNEIENLLKSYGGEMVYYSSGARNKGALVEKFQKDKNVKVFLGSFHSAKQSLTLTAAKTMIIHDVPTVYADKIQAEQRIHRIGQTEDVLVIYPVLKGTIEEKLLHVLNTRKEEADRLLGTPEKVWELIFGEDRSPGLK